MTPEVERGRDHKLVSLLPAKDSPDSRSAQSDRLPSPHLPFVISLSNMSFSLSFFPSIFISPIHRPPWQFHSNRPFENFWHLLTPSLNLSYAFPICLCPPHYQTSFIPSNSTHPPLKSRQPGISALFPSIRLLIPLTPLLLSLNLYPVNYLPVKLIPNLTCCLTITLFLGARR